MASRPTTKEKNSRPSSAINLARSMTMLKKQMLNGRSLGRSRMVDDVDKGSSSPLKTQIHELLENDNRTAAFDLLMASNTSKADFFDCAIFMARQLLAGSLVHECFLLLRSCHDKAFVKYGQPHDYTLFEEIGNMYYLLGQPMEAIKWYDLLLDKNAAPESKMYFNIGMCYQINHDYPMAIDSFLKSTSADSRFSKSWMNLGNCYIKQGMNDKTLFDKAIHAFQQLPHSTDSFTCLGNAYYAQGNCEEAVASYLKALEINEDPGVLNNLGCALKALNPPLLEDAIGSFQDSLALQPSVDAAVNLITILIETGDMEDAKQMIYNSKRIVPSATMKELKKLFKSTARGDRKQPARPVSSSRPKVFGSAAKNFASRLLNRANVNPVASQASRHRGSILMPKYKAK